MALVKGKSYEKVLTKENLVNWYKRDSLSQVDIAKKLGCSKHLVSWYMKKFRIKVRPVREFVILGMRRSELRKEQKLLPRR